MNGAPTATGNVLRGSALVNSACGVFAEKWKGTAAASEAGSSAARVFGPSVVGSVTDCSPIWNSPGRRILDKHQR